MAEGDEDRSARWMPWLLANVDWLAKEGGEEYRKHGWGFFFVSRETGVAWVLAEHLADLPPDELRDALAEMVSGYRPSKEVILVGEEANGRRSSYRLRLERPATN